MFKRILSGLLIPCTVLLFTSCSSKNYEISKVNDKYYITFDLEEDSKNTDENVSSMMTFADYPDFLTVSEMRAGIASGEIPRDELVAIRAMAREQGGTLEICDIDNLYDVVLPEGVQVTKVSWEGKSYSFYLKTDSIKNCYLSCYDRYSYEYNFDRMFQDFPNPETITDLKQISDRNATEILYQTSDSEKFKLLRYSKEVNGYMLHIQECYILSCDLEFTPDSEDAPYYIDIFAENNNSCFYVGLTDLDVRPTLEWLTSFSLSLLQ